MVIIRIDRSAVSDRTVDACPGPCKERRLGYSRLKWKVCGQTFWRPYLASGSRNVKTMWSISVRRDGPMVPIPVEDRIENASHEGGSC